MHRSSGGDHLQQIEAFVDQGFVDEVVGLVKTGKEASVYLCRAGPAAGCEFVAAKVYRAAQYRFKNDAVYQEARARELGLSGRALRAFNNRHDSSMGRAVQSGTWRSREYQVLQLLHESYADVPRPIAAAGEAILMEYFGDEDEAAQQLNRVRLPEEDSGPLFQRVMNNIELMLALNLVHGDLSPHNVLYWQGEMRIIDFPQATDPRFNRHAQELLARDVANIVRYFAQYGVEADAAALSRDLWGRFVRAEL
ncbi:MAG TPA: RIO1 family regulatory kinase/ATPase [Dehalococcoidia bacterium]|nr:RIO1 family regulatory kinase/ATPase [Dehalococcoidia bacterium]